MSSFSQTINVRGNVFPKDIDSSFRMLVLLIKLEVDFILFRNMISVLV